ncbi:Cyst_wall protein [Hexamita inflata]|uniref:Cyst wall protein n=1 Tax=Hexamita inflata TaxID=28002 RepID=A0AA86VE99_9EUKA|nr:Cyst wall protein [Hexamita inflata]
MIQLVQTLYNGFTTEREVLMSMYDANCGVVWNGASLWGTASDYCGWQGVSCESGLIVGLNLSGFGLTGTLPETLHGLQQLKSFIVNNNSLTSTIPQSICALSHLKYFQANSAGLTGQIPQCICFLQNLKQFYASNNSLTGLIPTCVGNMTFLNEVNLTCNKLRGVIPKQFDTLPQIQQLTVNCNNNIECYITLTRTNFLFICGNIQCLDCPVYDQIMCGSPEFIDLPNCGRYYILLEE